MLAVELILASRDWDVDTWNQQYTDLPNRQIKIQVSTGTTWFCEPSEPDDS